MFTFFTYGFLRGIRAEYKPPNDVIGHKFAFSFMNGFLYAFPPYGFFRALDTFSRLDIYLSGKDKTKYDDIYTESFGMINRNVLL